MKLPLTATTRSARGVLAAAMLLAAACGSSGDGAPTAAAESDTADDGSSELFDPSVVHEISVTFDEGDYDELMETYAESGEKISIEATVTIDGETYEQAGLRLKGNSSLAGLGGGFGGRDRLGGGEETDDAIGDEAESPEELPWLIELDEFVDQSHDGYEDIVIRSNNSETALNEAVALDLLEEAGLASQQAVATSFSVNGSDAVLRLAIEHPDDDAWYERAFDDADGALYKAESTGDWSYRGDDPEAYDEVFDQEGGDDVADLTPLIGFLEFVNESDDETFAAELAERLDVDAFATYLAMMDLVANFDDIDGPGNNAYLWWDAETEQFTVVPWDMNLAFGGGPGGGGPGGRGGPGGGGFEPPEGAELPDGFDPGQSPEGFDPGNLPEGAPELPEGFDPGELPEGAGPAGRDGGPGGGFGGRSNVLVERFLEVDEFDALYQEASSELRVELYESGAADQILDVWVQVLTEHASELVDDATIETEAEAVRSNFDTDE